MAKKKGHEIDFPYPSKTPVREIKTLFSILVRRSPAELATALHCGWVVQGYLQSLVWPVPATKAQQIQSLPRSRKISDDEAVRILGYLAGDRSTRKDVQMQGWLFDVAATAGKALRKELAAVLLPVLLKWLAQWAAGGGLNRLINRVSPKK